VPCSHFQEAEEESGFFDDIVAGMSEWADSINEDLFGDDGLFEGEPVFPSFTSWWEDEGTLKVQGMKASPNRAHGPATYDLTKLPPALKDMEIFHKNPNLKVRWAYGFSAMARNEFAPDLNAAIEMHFQEMKSQENASTLLELKEGDEWSIDFFNMRVTCNKPDGMYSWDLVRILPDTQFAPYDIPKKGSLEYINNSPIPLTEEELYPLFLRWDGSDNAWEKYERQMWGLYSPKENYILEQSYKAWLGINKENANYKVDAAYSVNFKAMVQFRTQNSYRQRPVRRILFKWFWKDNEDKWIPYEENICYQIERALVNSQAEVEVVLGDEHQSNDDQINNTYVINLLEMVQSHSVDANRRRSVLRIGPPLAQQVLLIDGEDDAQANQVLLNLNQSFPTYWQLPCKEDKRVSVNFKTSTLGKQIVDLVTKSCLGGQGMIYPELGYEVTGIHVIQSPALWSNFMYQKGKIMTTFSKKKNAEFESYTSGHPLRTPFIDGAYNEVYLFHGNRESAIERMCTDGFGISFRNASLSGFGGLYFCENFDVAHTYVTCPNCRQTPCSCSITYQCEPEYSLLLCRVILGNVYIDDKFNHSDYNLRAKSPVVDKGCHSILGVPEDSTDPREVIITNHATVYPEFLIQYKRCLPAMDPSEDVADSTTA